MIDRLIGDLDLAELAFDTRALRRARKIRNARALLHLSLARCAGALSLRSTVGWAKLAEVADIANSSLNDRLHQAREFFSQIVSKMLEVKARAALPRWEGRVIRCSDSTCVSKPGSKGTDWRIHAVYDLGARGFSHLDLTDKHGGEAIDRGAPVAGEIRIADRGFCNANAIHRFLHDAERVGGVDYIVRARWNALKLRDAKRAPFDLISYLEALPAEREIDDVAVWIQQGRKSIPIRLAIRRRRPEEAEAEIERLERQASRKSRTLDPRSLVAAKFAVLGTSLGAEYSATEILALYRLRWQIELAFKRLKSLLHIDDLPATTEKGARTWLYTQLIIAIATDETSQDLLDSFPSGPCRRPIHALALAH